MPALSIREQWCVGPNGGAAILWKESRSGIENVVSWRRFHVDKQGLTIENATFFLITYIYYKSFDISHSKLLS
jgi:hypothetical protein